MDLTLEAHLGYQAGRGTKCNFLYSSASAMAWHVGAWCRQTGRSRPETVSQSRGSTFNVKWPISSSILKVKWHKDNLITKA